MRWRVNLAPNGQLSVDFYAVQVFTKVVEGRIYVAFVKGYLCCRQTHFHTALGSS
jgi:hypothetical protein